MRKLVLIALWLLAALGATAETWKHYDNLDVDKIRVGSGRPWFDITANPYLADNTGTNDIVEAFQDLETAICASGDGGVIYLPPGTYKMTNPAATAYYTLIDCDDVYVIGAGPGITIIEADASDAEAANQTLVEFQDCDRCGIMNLSLHGNNTSAADTTGANNGFRGKGVTQFIAQNIYAKEFQYHCGGVRPSATRASSNFIIKDSYCDGGHETGWIVYSDGDEVGQNTKGLLQNLWATGADTYFGIEVRNSTNVTISDCHVWDNDGGGINIEQDADDVVIKGCHVQANGGHGIQTQCIDSAGATTSCNTAAERVERLKIIGNVLTDNASSGLRLDQTDTVLIEGNTMASNTENGMVISSSANVPTKLIVSNNHIESNGLHGVNDWRATNSAFVGRNYITGHTDDAGIEIIVTAASGTHIAQETYFSGNTDGDIFFSNNSDTCLTKTSAATIEDAEACRYLTPTGTTQIDTINHCAAGNNGATITIVCGAAATPVGDDAGNVRLSAAFTCGADDTLTLMCEGSTGDWLEIARSVN